jgi:hypothetical protein
MSSDDSESDLNKYTYNKTRRKRGSRKKPKHLASVDSDDEDDVISPLIRPFADFLNQAASSAGSLLLQSKPYRNLSPNEASNSKNSKAATTSSTSSSSDLVLIKYKQSHEESSYNSLRTSQLQKKREVQSLLLFIFFLFITIITLSQILVMHSQTNNSNFHQVKLMQEELKLMDLSIDRMLKEKHVLPIQVWFALKQYNDNLRKFSRYMSEYIYTNGSVFASVYNYTGYYNNSHFQSSMLYKTNAKKLSSSYSGEAINLGTISDDLMNQLKKCAHVELEFTFLDANKPGNAQVRSSLHKVYSKHASRVYTKMLESVSKLKADNSTHEFLNFTLYEPMLNDYLNMTGGLMSELTESSQSSQRKCVQNLFYSLYYYFNVKFSILFERHLAQASNGTAAFDNELIDETLRAIRTNYFMFNRNVPLNETDDLHLLKMPIRNVNDYVRKYKQSKNKFYPNKTLCDPVPPVLCKILNQT